MRRTLFILLTIAFIAGCKLGGETMVLLDEEIAAVKISESEGHGDMNQEVKTSFTDNESIKIFETAILTAVEQKSDVDMLTPDYDVMVEYETSKGSLPTHGIHLWLGEEDGKSTFTYITDETTYLTTSKVTNELRELLLSGE